MPAASSDKAQPIDRLPAMLPWSVLGAALAEGGNAAAAAPSWYAACAAFASAAATMVLATWPAGFAGARLSARPAGRAARHWLSGATGRAEIACLTLLAGCAGTLLGGSLAGRLLLARMTPPFAVLGSVLATLGSGAVCALVLPELGARLARRWPSRGSHRESSRRTALLLAAASTVTYFVIAGPLSSGMAAAPAAVLGGAALGLALPSPLRRARPLRRWGVLAVASACVGIVASFGLLPPGARRAVLYQTSYAGPLLVMAQRATDGDHDGHGTAFGGADCDDDDADVHPGAFDVPGNGIDEDCSGSDVKPFRPQAGPRWRLPPDAAPRNIVLLLMDALRPDHLGFAGYGRATTPNLDRFRRKATWFARAYTPSPSTRYAMASMFTGYDVRRVPYEDLGRNRFKLKAQAVTVAERLRAQGYQTVGHTISYVIHHNLGLGQGFEQWNTPWPVDDWRDIYGRAAEMTTRAAQQSLASFEPDAPFFLFAHYRCTHDPYVAHAEWPFGDRPIDAYDSALAYCDHQVGQLLTSLEARPDAERTAIFVVSDHGELFGEHGHTSHGNSLYEPDVRVLLLAKLPGGQVATVQQPVLLTDVGTTLLGLAGVQPPEDMDGWTLMPLAEHRAGAERSRPLFMFTNLQRGNVHYRASAVVREGFKLIRDLRLSTEELYDLSADPDEDDNLLDQPQHAERAVRLRHALEGFESYARSHPGGATITASP